MNTSPSALRSIGVVVVVGLFGCGGREHAASSGAGGGSNSGGSTSADVSSSSSSSATSSSAGGGVTTSTGSGGPAPCDGYEPCGVHPVAAPAGYTIQQGVGVSNGSMGTSCTSFADCDMWNTHFTPAWQPCAGCGAIDNGYNRMGSPFPTELSRYIFDVPPKRVAYVKFHMTAPGEDYVYGDGTPVKHTDPHTGVTSCFRRGAGHIEQGDIGNMGGTGNVGQVAWNISVLPGDMGNTGNASTCGGNGGTTTLPMTSDEAKAKTTLSQGKPVYCLLREGQDYYLNFMSTGKTYSVDCATQACSIGAFQFSNPTTSDGAPFLVEVPCGGG